MPRRARVWGAAMLAPVLLLPVLSTPAHAEQDPDSDTPAVSTTGLIDDQAALTLAAETGEPVEITAATTETTRHLANPDGTFTMEQSALPVRVRDEDGWTPVDTDLVAGADGALRPKAAVADIVFSGGGDQDLVSIGLGSKEVSLGWHEALPAPVVDGAQATYPDVLPDVDLVLTAGVDGFGQVLVVHTPEAAEHPDLAELELALATRGVTVHQGENGNLDAVGDQGGESVFTAVAPAMWDSANVELTGEDPTLMAPASARTEILDVDVTPDAIRLVPDQAMLTDTATEYPVYIDPSVAVSRQGRAYVDAKYPNQSYWNYPTSHDPGVGYEPQDGTTKRAFWRFAVDSRTANATITRATFRAKVTHAYGCGNAQVQLWRTDAIGSSTTWNSQTSAWRTRLDTRTINAGRSTCPGGASPTVEFNATAGYVWSRDAGNATTTLGLRGNETKSSTNYDWRRFDYNPTLQVDYNNPPEVPVQISDSHGGGCTTNSASPRLINEARPTFTAYVRDRDSTSASRQKVKTQFAWSVSGSQVGSVESPATDVAVWSSGSFQSARATALPENVLIAYRARAHDGTSWSAWSPYCYLRVNTSRPPEGSAVTSTDYPTGDTFHGSPGLPGEFTFSSNGVTTAKEYHYGFNDDSCTTKVTPSTQGGSVKVTLTPRQEGPNWIYARTVDGFGNSSDCVLVYSFLVAPPSDPVAHIGFDEGQGDRAADVIDPDRGATLSNGVDWVRGRVGTTENPATDPTPRMTGTAVHTSGYTDGDPGPYDQINADYPAVDTSGTFSVSVWVKLDRAYAHHTAVAQEGTEQSAFHLGYQGNTGQWVFKMSPEDEYWDGSRPWATVMSSQPAQIGVWTHLVGTYHEVTRKLTLYVDGVKQGEATHTGGWNATGPLTVGRGLFQGVGNYYWPGSIDDVRVWDRMVYDQAVSDREFENEIWRLANRPVAPQGRWALDEYDGTEIADSTDHGLDATLHGDPLTAWNLAENGATGSPGVRLNGTGEYIATTGPALRTDRSFSVATWVRLDETGGSIDATALAQSGPTGSAFRLGYRGSNGRWTFTLAPNGGSGTGTTTTSVTPARLGEWTHLVGVYDHTRKEMVLYVNGLEEARTAVTHAWHAAGPVHVGAARQQGSISHYWPGDIDDVHTYQGVLNERDRDRVYMGEFPNIQI